MLKENSRYFCTLVCDFFTVKHYRSRCRSIWENLDRFQHRFQPIKFVDSVVPSPCETQPYNNGEYWPEVVAVRTSLRSVRTKTTEGQYSPVRLELARLVSSLLYGTRTILVLSLPAFENKKIHSLWPFPWKRSVWRNPDQERTNQNARIYLAI